MTGNNSPAADAFPCGVVEERKERTLIWRLKAVPWMRVLIDALLLLSMLLASSRLITPQT